jgi:tetratricopeptide (TPR) repeat protein
MSFRSKCSFALIAVLYSASALCQRTGDPLSTARTLLSSGKITESEKILRTHLNADPSSADAHFLLGYVLFREQKPRESLVEFTAGARFRRPRSDEFKIIASDYVLLGDFSDADKWYSEVVAETPDDADAWYLLGRTKFNENDFPAAIAKLERALTLRPKYVEAENNIGLAWRELNNFDKSQAAFQTAIEWQGDRPLDAEPFLNLGTLLADQNNLDKAIPYLTKAATLSPENPSIHEELSHVYSAQQDLPKAQGELERAIALAPDISSLHFKLGQIYRKEGMRDRAQHEFAICEKLSGTRSSEKTPNPISTKSTQDR